MINVVYLVVLMWTSSSGVTSVSIPQASMKQCEVNKKYMLSQNDVKNSYCIVGVK